MGVLYSLFEQKSFKRSIKYNVCDCINEGDIVLLTKDMKIRQNHLETYTKNAISLLFSKYKFKSCVYDIITALVDNGFYVFTFPNETINLRCVFCNFSCEEKWMESVILHLMSFSQNNEINVS
jgi:hypothetical protein